MTQPAGEPAPPNYVDLDQLDPCELPELLIVDPSTGKGRAPVPGEAWTCRHGTTWVAVPVGIRGGLPQIVWIIQPPPKTTV